MSIVYNNSRAIGKCKSYEIEKVQGSKDFLKMVDFETFDRLNENQNVVLTWLKYWHNHDPFFTLSDLYESVEPGEYKYEYKLDISYEKLSEKERFQVLAAFAEWGLSQEVAE